MDVSLFQAVADLALGAKAKRDGEHREFLTFYRSLVETLPSEAVAIFGTMQVKASKGKEEGSYGLTLSATNYINWKSSIESGWRFDKRPSELQRDMLIKLAKYAESEDLDPKQRKQLIALLDPPVA